MKKATVKTLSVFSILMQTCLLFSQSNRYSYRIPEQLKDGWEAASLESAGIDKEEIENITRRIVEEERFELIYSMLIVKGGKLVHEGYFHGHQRNSLHWMASMTKTVSSTLIGIAIDKGFIKSVDESIDSLLPEYVNDMKDPRIRNIKLKHLMSMSSGLSWNEGVSYNDENNSEYQMVDSEDWMKYVLAKPLAREPGTRFSYNTGGIHLLSAIIKSRTGMLTNDFARKYLFEPLGIYAYQWVTDSTGHPNTGGTDGGLGLRTRDIAKLGWLFLKEGSWKGRRIISKEWIHEATKKRFRSGGGRYYGYNWFSGTMQIQGKEYDYIATFGYGGQTLYFFPAKDLILVFTCELTDTDTYVSIPVRQTLDVILQSSINR